MAAPAPDRLPIAGADSGSPLGVLARDLARCRARSRRLWRAYQATDDRIDPAEASTKAHRAWSEAVDEALEIAEAISRKKATSVADLLVQLEGIWWWIAEDDSILDDSTRRWLSRFRRSLRALSSKD